MKIIVIDSVDIFNDMMYMFVVGNKDRFYHVDDSVIYAGKYPKYKDIETDLAKYVDSLNEYISVHFLVRTTPPTLIHKKVVLDHKHLYAYLVKAIKSICKLNYMTVSMYRHDYETDADRCILIENLHHSVNAENCVQYVKQHKQMFI